MIDSLHMVTKQQEYQARFFQIVGFAFMTPIGNLFLKFPEMDVSSFNLKLLLYFLVSLLFVIVGIILNIKGMEYLEEKEQKWIQ